jgi:hypothetical protein
MKSIPAVENVTFRLRPRGSSKRINGERLWSSDPEEERPHDMVQQARLQEVIDPLMKETACNEERAAAVE